jgi:hypothetical protein
MKGFLAVMRIIRFVFFAVAALPCACLEMPITHIDKSAVPIVDSDASADGGPQAACAACMEAPEDPGPGCQPTFTACKDNPKCALIIKCGFERQCFQGSRREFMNCGLPCVTNNGVLTPDDPVLNLGATLFQCLANGPCGNLCFSSE